MRKLIFILTTLILSGCIPTNLDPLPQQTGTIDLNRYLGKWYQIAALPQVFSFNASCVTAEYSLNDDGSIKVVNKQIGPDGKPAEITGRATVEPNTGNSKLRVSFFAVAPPAPNYCIVEIADDYSYAVVSDPTKTSWWLLSRTPQMDAAKTEEIIARWKSFGINMSLLQRTVQNCE